MQSSEGSAAPEHSFALVSSAPQAEALLGSLCAELSRALGHPLRPRVLPSYAALRTEVEAGRAQIVWAPPRIAVGLEDAGLGSIDLCLVRGGEASYHAAIFTRHASPVETLADLRGRRAAWVDVESAAGYLVPRAKLREEGFDPATLFGREAFLGTHARVAEAVLGGEADVGGTYVSLDPLTQRPVTAGWLDAGAGINGALILATAGPIPADAIVFSRRLSADQRRALAGAVQALSTSLPEGVGRLFGAEGFAPARPAYFQALRDRLGTAG